MQLLVSGLCFGTMTFSGGEGTYKVIGGVNQKEADELVKGAIDGARRRAVAAGGPRPRGTNRRAPRPRAARCARRS